ncbi:MAG: L,D-transpeptidase [Butyrivibrio sp.]|uniref:L,D-transpeptidase n=1 Tax=Butyrivibrio sp. TaxID=28121 RepID=UPI0025BF4BB4|nr:L,D-transpeptidase [Butyrivibrio sp.]MBQ6588965.1 L,D-transpeptidase [Butyrivibrio sp.]
MKGMKFFCKGFAALLLVLGVLGGSCVRAQASDFDPSFYAAQYPDVVAAYGRDPNALYSHYVNFGINEGRYKNAQEAASGEHEAYTAPTTYVDVDLDNQTMNYYVDGVSVLSSPIVSGNIKNGNGTPRGVFFIDSKVPGKYLVGPTWNVWVNRWMRFTGAVGLHDASWRSEFGGDIYTYNGSHGCVNLPSDVANTLYDMVSVGTMVVVH